VGNTKLFDEATGRHLPIQYPEETEYWECARQKRLVVPKCEDCGQLFYPIGPVCKNCLSLNIGWQEVSGKGRISSYVVFHKAWAEWLKARVPYAVVQVELEEGPRLTTNLVEATPDEARIGLEVEAVFETVTDEVTLLQFRPRRSRHD